MAKKNGSDEKKVSRHDRQPVHGNGYKYPPDDLLAAWDKLPEEVKQRRMQQLYEIAEMAGQGGP